MRRFSAGSYLIMACVLFTCLCLFQSSLSSPLWAKTKDKQSKKSRKSKSKISDLKKQIEEYLCSHWTKERIGRFCIPATRHLTGQLLVPPTNNKIDGQLYPESEKELGRVEWAAYLNDNDELIVIELNVDKPGKYWSLSLLGGISRPFSFPQNIFNQDDFDRELVYRILANAFEAYSYAHFFQKDSPREFCGLGAIKIDSVNYDKAGLPTGFTAVLSNGQTLSGKVDSEMRLNNMLVDGKPNKYWTAMINEIDENIQNIFDNIL